MTAPDDVRARFEAWWTDLDSVVSASHSFKQCAWSGYRAAHADLAGEVRAMRACAIKYLGWLDVADPEKALETDMRDPEMCRAAALAKLTHQEKP